MFSEAFSSEIAWWLGALLAWVLIVGGLHIAWLEWKRRYGIPFAKRKARGCTILPPDHPASR